MSKSLMQLRSLDTMLRNEVITFGRLLYKGRNQHRHTIFYRRLKEVGRYSSRYEDMKSLELLNRYSQSIKAKKDAATIQFILDQLLGTACLIEQIIDSCWASVASVKASLLSPGYFLPWGMTMYAATSRIAAVHLRQLLLFAKMYAHIHKHKSLDVVPDELFDVLVIKGVKDALQEFEFVEDEDEDDGKLDSSKLIQVEHHQKRVQGVAHYEQMDGEDLDDHNDDGDGEEQLDQFAIEDMGMGKDVAASPSDFIQSLAASVLPESLRAQMSEAPYEAIAAEKKRKSVDVGVDVDMDSRLDVSVALAQADTVNVKEKGNEEEEDEDVLDSYFNFNKKKKEKKSKLKAKRQKGGDIGTASSSSSSRDAMGMLLAGTGAPKPVSKSKHKVKRRL